MVCPPSSSGPDLSDPAGPSPSWRSFVIRWGRRFLPAAIAGTATFFGGCFLALIAYAWVFPPITGVQLQRSVEAAVSGADYDRRYAPRPLSQLGSSLPLAVVAGEDSRFFLHGGIDWIEVRKSIQAYRRGEALRGASSITQQLVKNLFLTTHSTYLRKALEVPLAYAADILLSKRRILELYLNVIEWGPGVYGAEAAAQLYYGSTARSLNRYRAAALAACIPSPLTRHPQTVGRYQFVILRRMDQLGQLPLPDRPPTGSSFQRRRRQTDPSRRPNEQRILFADRVH